MTDRNHPLAKPNAGTKTWRVIANKVEVAQLAEALGLQPGNVDGEPVVPATFPLRWLFDAPIQKWVRQALHPANVLMHEEQEIVYHAPIQIGAAYDVSIGLERSATSSRVAIVSRVVDTSGQLVCMLVSKARIID